MASLANGSNDDTTTTTKRSWRKVLYEKQSYPDNYIDREKFLEQLNMDVISSQHRLGYWSAVQNASVVAHQLSIVVIFLSMYKYAVAGKCGKYDLVAVNSSALLIYVVVTRLLDPEYFQSYRKNPMDNMRKLFVSGVVLRVSAPVLQTLTSSFSENTVHSLILITSTFHLITFDYNFLNNTSNNNLRPGILFRFPSFTSTSTDIQEAMAQFGDDFVYEIRLKHEVCVASILYARLNYALYIVRLAWTSAPSAVSQPKRRCY
jgi:hypothetical protein